jgi:FAD/FMN-containing dehydrogenase
VGGGVPVHDEIILNLKNMNKIINFDVKNRIFSTESGVILQNVNKDCMKGK